jgi:hypothetical protein
MKRIKTDSVKQGNILFTAPWKDQQDHSRHERRCSISRNDLHAARLLYQLTSSEMQAGILQPELFGGDPGVGEAAGKVVEIRDTDIDGHLNPARRNPSR